MITSQAIVWFKKIFKPLPYGKEFEIPGGWGVLKVQEIFREGVCQTGSTIPIKMLNFNLFSFSFLSQGAQN